jgi:predicted kinase
MEAVIFCGIQASGKSTFYLQRFFNTHVRINLDMLKTRQRERMLLHACLVMKQPFVVDNTNLRAANRRVYIDLARKARFRVICYYFESDVKEAMARNLSREGKARIPPVGVYSARAKLQPPTIEEGFDEMYRVRVAPEGGFEVEKMGGD